MGQNEQHDDKGNAGKEVNSYAKYSGVAFQMIAVIGVFAFAGYKIDEAAGNHHEPSGLTAALSLVGCIYMHCTLLSDL
jgi:hypothetical protein